MIYINRRGLRFTARGTSRSALVASPVLLGFMRFSSPCLAPASPFKSRIVFLIAINMLRRDFFLKYSNMPGGGLEPP